MDVILGSVVIAAIVAAVVSLRVAQRKISIENITQDRRMWREKVRENALSVHDAIVSRDEKSLNRLRAEFVLILNPNDINDEEIVNCINLPEEGREVECADELSKRIALLLKHDWERAKLEAGSFVMKIKKIRNLVLFFIYEPERKKYE